jgi:outer membrane protein OmpA-like peptidoglycan-associated protein
LLPQAPIHPILQLQRAIGNRAVRRLLQSGRLQTKLNISRPGDIDEQEADRAAEEVMRMPEPAVQRACAPCAAGGSPCPKCESEKENLVQRSVEQSTDTAHTSVPDNFLQNLGPGQPLDSSTRGFFERRFGQDFSHVRVHAGTQAADSAGSMNALAYTIGRDVVFGAGQYAPGTFRGQRLLAHELTHVLQQRSAAPVMQRTCGEAALGAPAPDCTRQTVDVPGEVFYFVVDCDDLQAGEDRHLECFAAGLPPGTVLKVHGFASTDGDAAYNWNLSCHRANQVSILLRRHRPDLTVTSPNFKHGPTAGPAASRRSVTVEAVRPATGPTPTGVCGPDATDWFVRQVNTAMRDVAVLAVQADMTAADAIARTHGTTAQAVAEGGAAAAVVAQVSRMTTPPPATPAAAGQIVAGTASGTRAARSLALHPFDAAAIGTHIHAAAIGWRALVNHGARYDFKAHTMRRPTTPCCPSTCPDTITLCVGSAPENCYLTDLPGNLFYALIGRFVGFSELTLQLGSQLAQLTGTATWDPPQDTAAIHLGFSLPLPVSAGGLCGLLPPVRGSLTAQAGCIDCRQPTTAAIR